jgi:hypothetical protein
LLWAEPMLFLVTHKGEEMSSFKRIFLKELYRIESKPEKIFKIKKHRVCPPGA